MAGEILGQPAVPADAEPAPTKIEADPDAAETEYPAMWSLADTIPTGSTAAVALIEHVWAAPLSAAIQRAGGTALEETWLAQQDMELLESLMARQDR